MSGAEAAGARRRSTAVGAIAVAAAAILVIGVVSTRGVAAGPEAAPSPQATGYLPSISDLMIATIQSRHERLWRAWQDGNWEFAAYELGNLHGAFDRRACPSDRTRHLISGHDRLRYASAVQGAEQRDPIERWHRIRQGLCRSDRRMQFMPPGAQPRCSRNPYTEPDVHVGLHDPELRLAMPEIDTGAIRETF
jgi:hypothetical protein